MPRISKDRKVIAKAEPLGLYERILLKPLNRYKLPILRRRRLHAPPIIVVSRPHDPERGRRHQEAIEQLRERHYEWLAEQKAKLSPPPLIDRISDLNLHFRKTKILSRIKEFENLFVPTVERLTPLIKKALADDRISEDVKMRFNVWGKEFNELWVDLDNRGHKLTNKEWRILKRQLKAIGQISFANLEQRLPEICQEIDALNLSFNFAMSYTPFVPVTVFQPLNPESINGYVINGLSNDADPDIAVATRNAVQLIEERVPEYTRNLTAEMAQHMDAHLGSLMQHINHLTAQVTTLTALVQNQQALVTSYKQQVDALPASTGGGSRQPKIGEPPIFKGSDDKIKLEEWRNLISLWCAHEGITTDKQKIVTALSRLQGPAHKYMASYYDRVGKGQDLGTWDAFMDELAQIYGQRDDKEGAKKEITALFNNKDLAAKDFIKYAERFRTLGRLTGYDDELLIDKLREVVSRDMRIALVGTRGSNAPKKWPDFLDMLLDFYRELNPEKTRGTVFSKSGSDGSGHTPMDIDSAEKSKAKGRNGKQANAATTEKKNRFCHICKSKTYNTDDCFELARNADKKAEFQSQSKGTEQKTGGNNAQSSKPGKVKKTRIVEVEVSDNEDEPPKASASISTARIEQEDVDDKSTLTEEDEPQTRPSRPGKGKARASTSSDFLTRYM
ncbi:hypothetical protein ACG7TL_007236 [Trametes sanguinea]